MDQLGLVEDAKLVSDKVLQSMFQDRMSVIEQSCIDDVHELLLERADLFINHFPDPKDISTAVQVMNVAYTHHILTSISLPRTILGSSDLTLPPHNVLVLL